MSDHWEMFPCAMGEHTAWVSYDHGIREEIRVLPFAYSAKFKVVLQAPDDRGLPEGDEFARLNDIEDALTDQINRVGGCAIGRITTNGARYFFFYTSASEEECGVICERVAADSGYDVLLAHQADSERTAYWNELFPTADDWRVIQDLRVEESLRKNGDTLNRLRSIEHWAYFKTSQDRERFLSQVTGRFESTQSFDDAKSSAGPYAVKLQHTGLPDYQSMNEYTIFLERCARECGGHYDGWETQVCRE